MKLVAKRRLSTRDAELHPGDVFQEHDRENVKYLVDNGLAEIADEAAEDAEKGLADMKIAELKEYAEAKGIELESKNKADIIAEIEAAEDVEEEVEEEVENE